MGLQRRDQRKGHCRAGLSICNVQPTSRKEKISAMDRHMLVLDLDESLVFATETPLERKPDFVFGPYAVYKRPFLAEFLAAVSQWFDLAVWSSAGSDYVNAIVSNVFPDRAALHFVWASDRCTHRFNP